MIKSRALICNKKDKTVTTSLIEMDSPYLEKDEVLIQAEYSSINYKDALGVTGRGAIFKQWPIIPGIDVAGTVLESRSKEFQKNDHVLVTGCGLGETHNGGYSELVKEHAKNIIHLPKGLSLRDAMIYGTAGFTAALCLMRMNINGQKPEMGPILITGASGGVGQLAISIFKKGGYTVHALTGKKDLELKLMSLGAEKVHQLNELTLSQTPLASVRFGGIVDNVGGEILAGLLPQVELWGNVASVGLASGAEFKTTVMPFILRGVSLLGISSNNTPRAMRQKIWEHLSSDWKPENLDEFVTHTVGLEDIVNVSEQILARQHHGRTIVKLK
jgi:acrylyl-CoA reductase (NADPH)